MSLQPFEKWEGVDLEALEDLEGFERVPLPCHAPRTGSLGWV